MTSPVNSLSYLQQVLAAGVQQTWAVVTQNADGTLTIGIDVGPGPANETIPPLQGPTGAAGAAQFPLMLMPDVLLTPEDLQTDLTNTGADIGKYWIIYTTNELGEATSSGAYIWFGDEYRFLPFGNQGPPGPYGVMRPFVNLVGSREISEIESTGTGSASDPYLVTMDLAVPQGPQGRCMPLAEFPDVDEASPPLTGQLMAYTGNTVSYDEQDLPLWAPTYVADIPPQPYIVPASAFVDQFGIEFQAGVSVNGVGAGANTLMNVASFSWSHNTLAGSDVFVATACSGTAVPTGVTYGGQAMTLLGTSVAHSGGVSLWHLANCLGGAQSVVVSIPTVASTYMTGNSVSCANVGSVGSLVTTGGSNTSAGQTVSCGADQLILQAFGFAGVPEFPFGGLIAYHGSADSNSAAGLLFNYAKSSTHFATLGATASGWDGAATVLLPSPPVATIATFTVPSQLFAWKPLVWGQVQMFEIGVFGSPDQAFLIGLEVYLGSPNPDVGTLVARGFGNDAGGTVTIMPHTSSPGSPTTAMNPWNEVGLVAANTAGAAATLYVNVVNDGLATVYDYKASTAQLFVLACPSTSQEELQQIVYGSLPSKVTLRGQAPVNAHLDLYGVGTLGYTNLKWHPQTVQFNASGVYIPPSWWVSGTNHIDIIGCSDGGGAGTVGDGDAGGPGSAGTWGGATINTLSSGQLTITIGTGGKGSSSLADGASGTGVTVKDGATTKLSVSGAAGGSNAGGGSPSGTSWYGPSPGNETYNSVSYYGGQQTTTGGGAGGWPGGGGAGATVAYRDGGNGAAGGVWIVARL